MQSGYVDDRPMERSSSSREERELLVLVYNEAYVAIPDRVPDCPVRHSIVFDRAYLDRADAVIFHLPTLAAPLPLSKRPGQYWVALSAESDMVCLRLRDAAYMRNFDFTMTYRLDSDFPATYLWPQMTSKLLAPPWCPRKTGDAVIFMSGPANFSFREEYVTELMRYMSVHSYGRVLNNRTLPVDEGRTTKLETIARYRFTLAFENSITDDYVTEKFTDPLLVGSVPVYLGSQTVERFSPADHCYIDVRDFSSPRALAAYLTWLARNSEAYESYLSWKRRALRRTFIDLAEAQRIHPIGRLCMHLARDRSNVGRLSQNVERL